MSEREVRCVHCQIYVVATLEGEWEGSDVDILGPVVCIHCILCLARDWRAGRFHT